MLASSPLYRLPSEWHKKRPTLQVVENECFIEDLLLEDWLLKHVFEKKAAGRYRSTDWFLPFIWDPWENDEVAKLIRNAIAGRIVGVNLSHEPGALFITRGKDDVFFVFEVVGEALDKEGYPVIVQNVQRLVNIGPQAC